MTLIAIPGSEPVESKLLEPLRSTRTSLPERITATIYLKPLAPYVEGRRLTVQQHQELHGARQGDVQRIVSMFESSCGIKSKWTRGQVPSTVDRRLNITASPEQFARAFGVSIGLHVAPDGTMHHCHSGPILIPDSLSDIVEAVLGLDGRPVAKPHFRIRTGERDRLNGARPLTPMEVAELYGFPRSVHSGPQCGIGIPELGGGYRQSDLLAIFNRWGLPAPIVEDIVTDGTINSPGDPNGADGEVALDIQVAAAAYAWATGRAAKIFMGFGANSDAGEIGCILDLIHCPSVQVISYSWGGPENSRSPQSIRVLDQALQAAAALGKSFLCAAGDAGSSDGTAATVADYPASSPWAIAVGGTRLIGNGSTISSETVWNNGVDQGQGGTGGAPSAIEPIPAYQQSLGIGGRFRVVCDIASNADPDTGFPIMVDGTQPVVGGTSSGAPMLAAGIAMANEILGQNLGDCHKLIYSAAADCFNDITQGNNGAFPAAVGFDVPTGRGSIRWGQFIAYAKSQLQSGQPNPPTPTPIPIPPAAGPTESQVLGAIQPTMQQLAKEFSVHLLALSKSVVDSVNAADATITADVKKLYGG